MQVRFPSEIQKMFLFFPALYLELTDLVIIGKLFEHQEVSDPENKELVIFITPYIVNNDSEQGNGSNVLEKSLFAREYKNLLKELDNSGEL